uniref:Uncharacterized protein n=1 Tax=Arundo donax TaxID=35708 RepID=A0A0A8ZRJ2_ARUDO
MDSYLVKCIVQDGGGMFCCMKHNFLYRIQIKSMFC